MRRRHWLCHTCMIGHTRGHEQTSTLNDVRQIVFSPDLPWVRCCRCQEEDQPAATFFRPQAASLCTCDTSLYPMDDRTPLPLEIVDRPSEQLVRAIVSVHDDSTRLVERVHDLLGQLRHVPAPAVVAKLERLVATCGGVQTTLEHALREELFTRSELTAEHVVNAL